MELNLVEITNNILDRYDQLGKEINIKELEDYIDWDGDGIAGNENQGGGKYLRFEVDTLYIPKQGGTFKVKIESSVRYGYPEGPTDIITDDSFYHDLGVRSISFNTDLKEDYLEVRIDPAEAYMLYPGSVMIESADRRLTASLILKQEGDKDKFSPDEDVKDMYRSMLGTHYEAYAAQSLMEAIYTGGKTIEEYGWEDFATRSLTPYNPVINFGFSLNYGAARNMGRISELLAEYNLQEVREVKASFDCLFALSYYPLGILWENVPYLDSWDIESAFNAPQISSEELFSRLANKLLQAMEVLPESNDNEFIILSKNVARGILGKMYMRQKQYAEAYNIYRRIIDSNEYSTSVHVKDIFKKGSRELIYSFDNNPESYYYKYVYQTEQVPVITYMEVLLSITECAFRLGNQTEAIEYATQAYYARTRSVIPEVNVELLDMLWKRELTGTLSYFDFLKRNGLAEEVLNIEEFQTRFPIPQDEINRNPNVVQNPGYR